LADEVGIRRLPRDVPPGRSGPHCNWAPPGGWDRRQGTVADQSLYERLGGVFAIAAVVNHFSDAVVNDAIAGEGSDNPALREWHRDQLARLPGLKFMRTLWLCSVAGGPFEYVGTKPGHDAISLEEAHRA